MSNGNISNTGLIAISATFTAEPLSDALSFWMSELGLDHKIKFAQYNQVFQQLLDASSLLAQNRGGLNVVMVRPEDWVRFSPSQTAGLEAMKRNAQDLAGCVEAAADRFSSPLVVMLCPSSRGFLATGENAAFVTRLEEMFTQRLRGHRGIDVLLPRDISRLYPVEELHDPHGDELGHVPYTAEYFAALATVLARKVRAQRQAPFKVVVLDCDDTLWSGICGEDGPLGVEVDAGRRALQAFMKRQRDAGMLLAIASKNNEEDVFETFRAHADMPLRIEDFAAWRINWDPKPENLKQLADELGLGLESFIFVDDNPKECSEVESSSPEVVTLPLPADPAEIGVFLEHVWAFDRTEATEEDRRRGEMYAQNVERARLARRASSMVDFLSSLELSVRIEPARAEQLARVAQLTMRTNQMNCTTIRRSESDLRDLLRAGGGEILTVEVSDRFGSYGLTGAVVFRSRGDALEVDTFLLSCRVLGRGVEHRLLAHVGELAAERGLNEVLVAYAPTARNKPALAFLSSLGAAHETAAEGGLLFRLPVELARSVRIRDSAPVAAPAAAPRQAEQQQVSPDTPDYLQIARALRTAEAILAEMKKRRSRPAAIPASSEPRTELEARLAALWAELLRVQHVGIHDNFFDLGGHSLAAVQLLSQVRQEFGVEVTLEVVYGGAFTVAELAKAIELREIEQAPGGDFDSLMAEIEELSEEEAKALLEKEQQG